MTISDAQRAYLVEFAYREAGPGASLESMLAICYIMRNRQKKQWEDGNWIRLMERADQYAAHEPGPRVELDPDSRQFQRLLREVDDVFYGGGWGSGSLVMDQSEGGRSLEESLCEPKHPRLYWMFVGKPVRPWFLENIVRDPQNHPQRGTLNTMMFFE